MCVFRRCFLIYRYPGKSATVISEDDFVDKVETNDSRSHDITLFSDWSALTVGLICCLGDAVLLH